MGRGINSKSQININKKCLPKKGHTIKKNKAKHTEKIESSNKVHNIPKSENLYKSDKKTKSNYNNITVDAYNKRFKPGRPRNLHKRGSTRIVRKIRKKPNRPNPNMKRKESPKNNNIPGDQCVVCLDYKKMTGENTIKCGNIPHVLCNECKKKIKDNKCPLCRSHPIEPEKEKKLIPYYRTRRDIINETYNLLRSWDRLEHQQIEMEYVFSNLFRINPRAESIFTHLD